MIINNNLQKNLVTLRQNIDLLIENNSLTNLQIENFLRNFEKTRYNILNEITFSILEVYFIIYSYYHPQYTFFNNNVCFFKFMYIIINGILKGVDYFVI